MGRHDCGRATELLQACPDPTPPPAPPFYTAETPLPPPDMGTAPTADAIGGVTTSTRKSKIETPADPIRADLETLPDHDLRLLADKVKERGIVAVDRRWGRARLLDVLVAAGVKSDILDEPALVPPPPPPPDLL